MNRFGEAHNSTFNFDDFDISDASVSIPPVPKPADNGGSPVSSTPYNYFAAPGPGNRNGAALSPFPRRFQKENKDRAPVKGPLDSKLVASDFAISESDDNNRNRGQQRTPLRTTNGNHNFGMGGFSDILSPQVPASEVKRHFNDFSSAFNLPDNNAMFDQSIEVGRSNGKHQPDRTFSSVASSRGDSPRNKVTDKPGSVNGGRRATSPDFPSSQPFAKRKTDSVSSNEKVTSSSSSPNIRAKSTFKIPTGYGDDASFFEKLGIKKPQLPSVGKKGGFTSNETETDASKGKTNDPITLPDISGLSSIFSSDDNRPNAKRATSQQHKTLVSVPLDPDEKGM